MSFAHAIHHFSEVTFECLSILKAAIQNSLNVSACGVNAPIDGHIFYAFNYFKTAMSFF